MVILVGSCRSAGWIDRVVRLASALKHSCALNDHAVVARSAGDGVSQGMAAVVYVLSLARSAASFLSVHGVTAQWCDDSDLKVDARVERRRRCIGIWFNVACAIGASETRFGVVCVICGFDRFW